MQRDFFTALGFLAVVLGDVPKDKQAYRAQELARLMQEFCVQTSSDHEVLETKEVKTAPTFFKDKDAMTDFVERIVSDSQHNKKLLNEAAEALELVMQDGLNFSTEQAAERAIHNIRQFVV